MHAFKNRKADYKGKEVTILRGANAGDGEFDLTKPHFLIRDGKGAVHVVPAPDVTPKPVKGAEQ